MGITFKKEPKEIGLMACGHPYQNVKIKYNKKEFGLIIAPSWQTKGWKIMISIIKEDIMEDGNPNCPWMWKTVKQVFNTEEEARKHIKEHEEEIVSMNLNFFEER